MGGGAGPAPMEAGPRLMDSREAFLETIRLHGDKAYNFAYRLTGNDDDAQDLVQEAFMRAYRSRERYDPSRPFESWLFKIMQNIFLDAVRRKEHEARVSLDSPAPGAASGWDELLPGADADPADEAASRERDALLQRALDALPIHYRSAVALCDVEEMSYEEIARVMGCPVGTVRSRVHQGRLLLRRAFESLQRGGGAHDA